MPPSLNALADCHVASCCVAFATLPLDAPPPVNAPTIVVLPLIAPPLLLILSACPCLSTRRLHLPLSFCLSFAPAGCCIASHCAASTSHPLYVPLPLALADCHIPSSCTAFATLHLDTPTALSLVAPPLPLVVSAHCCLLMRSPHLPLPFASCFPRLVVVGHDHDIIKKKLLDNHHKTKQLISGPKR
jgi:hypothetical protein